MNDRHEQAPWMREGFSDYRDDYIKAQLAQAVYYSKEDLIREGMLPREVPQGARLPLGWSLLGDDRSNALNHREDKDTGFAAAAFEGPGGRIVISFRGSDDLLDWNLIETKDRRIGPNPVLAADSGLLKELGVPVKTERTSAQLAAAQEHLAHKLGLPDWNDQFGQALDYVDEIRRRYPDRAIEVTGHSLGGAHAELSSHTFGLDGRAFDPPGAKNILDSEKYRKWREAHGIERNEAAITLGLPIHQPDFINYLVKDSLVSHKSGPHIYEDRMQEISSLFGRDGRHERLEWAIGKAGAVASDLLDKLPPLIDKVAKMPVDTIRYGELTFKAMAESDTLNRHEMGRITEVFREAAETGRLPTFGKVTPDRSYDAPQMARASESLREPGPYGSAQVQVTRQGPFNDPFLDRAHAAALRGDGEEFDRIAREFSQSPEGQRMAQLGEELYARQQLQEQQLAQAQSRGFSR